MKNVLLRKTFSFTALAFIAGLSLTSVQGQATPQGAATKVVGEKPAFDDLQSPEYTGPGRQKRFTPKDWLEIETKLKVAMNPIPKSKTCDKLTVKWYVAVKNPDKPGTMLLLTKDVEHVNIPLDEDIYSSVYLSPASIKRLTGSDKAGKNAVEYVGYEVFANGEKVLQETNKGKNGWWAMASEKISRNETVPLLNKAETPFRAMWWDRYAEVSEARR